MRRILAAAVIIWAAAGGRAAFVPSESRGWYTNTGTTNAPGQFIYVTGTNGTTLFNSFFGFNLTGLSGTVFSATLRLYMPTRLTPGSPGDGYQSNDPTETFVLSAVGTNYFQLTGGTGTTAQKQAAFTDLGDGATYGSVSLSAATNGTTVVIALNAAGVAAVQASLGGRLAIGGTVTTLSGRGEVEAVFFGTGNDNPADGQVVLDVQLSPPTPSPAPPTVLAAGVGVAGFALARRVWRGREPGRFAGR